LAVRYGRLKANITIADDHIPAMMDAEVKVNQAIEDEIKELRAKKWSRIAKLMEEAGTVAYNVSSLYDSLRHDKLTNQPAAIEKSFNKQPKPADTPIATPAPSEADTKVEGDEETKF
jgi:hypothetical protein